MARKLVVRQQDMPAPHVGLVRTVLKGVIATLDGLADKQEVAGIDRAEKIAAAYSALEMVREALPKINAWAIMKVYKDPGWTPAIWCACLSEKQAEAVCAAVKAHYDADAKKHGWRPDGWKVERRPVRVLEILHPDTTAAEYVSELRS